MTADERLMAYLDGELSVADHTDFEAEMAATPALATKVAQHRRLRVWVAGAYAPVLDEPLPPQLLAVASVANDARRRRLAVPQWAAIAASLVLGVLAGRELWPGQGPLVTQGGELVARGELAKALTTQLASDAGPVRIAMSFKARDGRYCRTFQSAPDRLAGLACRRDGRWVAQTTTGWAPQPGAVYRTAASAMPPEVLATIDALSAGETLDGMAERAARARGWRN